MYVQEVLVMDFKIPKEHTLYTKYFQENGDKPTHILLKKNYAEQDKRWILYSVNLDNTLTKVCQGSNPQSLEDNITYIKKQKELHI
jgi:hypothetical protein